MADDTGLTKAAAQTPAVITTPEQYRGAMALWEQHYNVLTPFTNVSGIASSFGLIAAVVKISTELVHGEVYAGTTESGARAMPFLKGERGKPNEEFAIAKVGLRKLAECAGISTSTVRTDPRTFPNYWEFKAIATYRGLDGSNTTREATFEWDLRDGSDRMKGWTPNQITEGRKNGLRACEARAINAAIRECGCGIKQKYTRAELEKPFVVVRVAFQPDLRDPEIKRMVTQQALQGANALYPAAPRALAAAPDEDDEPTTPAEPRSIGRGTTTPTTPPADVKAATTTEAAAFPEGFGLIQKVEVTTLKKRADPKQTFPKWTAIDYTGVAHVTIKREFGAKLERCYEEHKAVDITSEENSYGENDITEILEHDPSQGSLLPDRGAL